MKKYLSSVLSLALSVSAYAQQTKPVQYKLPDGQMVSHAQLDSVDKAWGGHGYMLSHDSSNPAIAAVSPMTDEYLKKRAEEDANLKALLNRPAPNFTLTDIKGKKWTLATLKGKTVVLNFWFTTCPGCIQEMPELNALQKSYAKSDVVFLAPGLDDAKAIKRFLKSHPFRYNLLANGDAVSELYRVSAFPTSMVIDPQGVIRFQQVGGKNIKEEITAAIASIRKNY